MKKTLAVFLSLLLLLGIMTACGAENVSAEMSAAAAEHFESFDPEAATYPITIEVWICNTGDTQQYLLDSAEAFNASQDKYIVNLTYSGSYADTLLKMQTSTPNDRPDIFATDTEGAYTVYGNKDLYVPLQYFVDYDNYDMSDILNNLYTC